MNNWYTSAYRNVLKLFIQVPFTPLGLAGVVPLCNGNSIIQGFDFTCWRGPPLPPACQWPSVWTFYGTLVSFSPRLPSSASGRSPPSVGPSLLALFAINNEYFNNYTIIFQCCSVLRRKNHDRSHWLNSPLSIFFITDINKLVINLLHCTVELHLMGDFKIHIHLNLHVPDTTK